MTETSQTPEAPKSPLRSLRLFWHRLAGRKTTTLDGLRLVCDPAKMHRSVATAIIKGSYEAPERVLVRAALRPGDKVVEVGTGVGVVSLLCNKLAGAGNVTSFEANAALEPVIRENFALNGMEPRLRLRAVTVDGAPISFFRNENVVSSSIYDRGLQAQKVTVESDAIDRVLKDEQATVLVMDVEGAEIDLLQAANLSGLREIIVELHPHIVGEAATRAMIDSVCARGFRDAGRIHKNIRLSRTG
ncbi:FkbM family methyltransferase [Rhodobacter sp. Har01]|uniref:FkbM family methyltransferase n=1 Tax=Rhodobacter sp. Har01 TaxID=2883999 RepID=UPI001D07EDDF|nr:FkbM family methyltransferase [Rhodobacter sp. Har01]MCB6178831.1 FkbM family methyltransferase [Rhodobacter sp. Har01]